MTTIAPSVQPRTTTHVRIRRAATVLVVVASALAARAVVASLLGVDLTVGMGHGQPPMMIGFGLVAATSLVAALAGWASLAALEWFSRRARAIWITVAIVVLLVSFAPLAALDAAGAAKAALVSMHLVVAAVLILGLTRRPLTSHLNGARR